MDYISLNNLFEMKDNNAIQDILLGLLANTLSIGLGFFLEISKRLQEEKGKGQSYRISFLAKEMQRTVTIWKTD